MMTEVIEHVWKNVQFWICATKLPAKDLCGLLIIANYVQWKRTPELIGSLKKSKGLPKRIFLGYNKNIMQCLFIWWKWMTSFWRSVLAQLKPRQHWCDFWNHPWMSLSDPAKFGFKFNPSEKRSSLLCFIQSVRDCWSPVQCGRRPTTENHKSDREK